MVVHTIKWFHQVMKHTGEEKFTWDVEPTSSSSQALVSDWYRKKLPSILTPPTGNIIFKTSELLESCQVKVNGRQVEFNALTCIDGPEGRPNNLQSAWRLAELFFWSDLSWSRADLCANSYVICMHFSLLSSPPLCTLYISNVGIKTGLNSFQNFPYVTTFLLRFISVFYLWKTEWFWKELSPSETVIFVPRDFGKRSFSEILDQCNFRKNEVWRFFLNSLLSYLLSKNTWTGTILERMESDNFFRKAYYCIYLIQTPSWQIRTRTILEKIDSEFNS